MCACVDVFLCAWVTFCDLKARINNFFFAKVYIRIHFSYFVPFISLIFANSYGLCFLLPPLSSPPPPAPFIPPSEMWAHDIGLVRYNYI